MSTQRNDKGQFVPASLATTVAEVAEDLGVTPIIVSKDGTAHTQGDYKFTIAVNGKPLTNKNSETPQGYYTQQAAVNAATHLAKSWGRTLQVLPYPKASDSE